MPKIIRVLVYEGPDEWLKSQFAKNGVIGKKQIANCSITEYFISSELPNLLANNIEDEF